MKIKPARSVKGTVALPGDKSISHRAAMIAALANGSSTLVNFSNSRDCASTLSCLAQLGVSIEQTGNATRIESPGFRTPAQHLDCGNSGSTMRMMAGLLAGQKIETTLTGDASLSKRPMDRVVAPLRLMGARIESRNGFPPLRIFGDDSLSAIDYELPVASAQVKTALLLAGLQANGRTVIKEANGRTRDHTERMLRSFDVPVVEENDSVAVVGPATFGGREVRIPGDLSAAAYFIAAAALLADSELTVDNVGLNPTRSQFIYVMRSLGANIGVVNERMESDEPVGTLWITPLKQSPQPKVFSGGLVPSLIDELPLLAVVGTQTGGVTIKEAAELRLKESDRIAATVTNLRAMGAEVEEFDDGLEVRGPVRLKGAKLDSLGDHRIAMAFAIAALLAEGESEILESDCVAISFPDFFGALQAVAQR
jgi:3-phosphoshikimate 1-carboxyvinyltransferase